MSIPRSRALGRQPVQIALPLPVVIPAKLIQYRPGVEPGTVSVVEDEAHCIASDRLDPIDADAGLVQHEDALSRAVTRDLGGGRMDPQILGREPATRVVVEQDFELAGTAVKLDGHRHGFVASRHCQAPLLQSM
jgi:hypothetical protein